MEITEENNDTISITESRHRKEKKELQAQIQALKKAAKNDKTKKKEILLEVARLEAEMETRHTQELEEIQKDIKNCISSEENDIKDIQNEVSKVKISKAQRRRDKKSQLDKEREELIKQQEKENLHGPRNKEIKDLTAKLKARNLKIYTIPSDGDCLYKAVEHQLFMTRNQNISVKQLRKLVSDYMIQNKDDFLPFMTNQDTFDMLTDEEFQIYCDKISSTNVWGGQLEIRALSNCLKCPINIIQATGPECIEQGSEFDGPPLVLTYHRHMYQLGEHYNSTIVNDEIDDE